MSRDLLGPTYDDLVGVLADLDEAASWTPTGCVGWSVRDLTFHLLEDARRGLVALHSPAEGPPDTDRVDYWAAWGSDAAADARGRRFGRVLASMFGDWDQLRDLHAGTVRALLHAVATSDERAVVTTQGHTLTVADLLSTLRVEATIHHLDLIAHLPGRPGPAADALAEARTVLSGVAGSDFPSGWDDTRVVLLGTGRAEPSAQEARSLGALGRALPLFS